MKSCLTSSEISKYDDIILSKSVQNDKNILFPKDFILGVSTSSYQVEGSNDKCNWSIFENKQKFEKKKSQRKLLPNDQNFSYIFIRHTLTRKKLTIV